MIAGSDIGNGRASSLTDSPPCSTSRASNVTQQVIANSGHWLMEEQPAATVAAITAFLR